MCLIRKKASRNTNVTSSIFFVATILIFSYTVRAQDKRAKVPSFLTKSYYEINLGYINYPFGEEHIQSGFTVESIRIPHVALRLVLFGYEFNKYISAQITYMRPFSWVVYNYYNDTSLVHNSGSVWMNVAGLTMKLRLPLKYRFSLFGELGMCMVTRHGFDDFYTNEPFITNAVYASWLIGGGIKYQLNKKWGFMFSTTYTPPNKKVNQPYTIFYSLGVSYNLQPFSEKQIEKAAHTGYIYPRQMIQIGFSSNVFGYGINNFLSQKVYVFWGGDAEVAYGLSINYQRNIFHTAKVFSLDWGVNFSYWQSNIKKEFLYTLSLFPLFRFTFLHTKPVDMYFCYSVAGPTYISKIIIDDSNTGTNFTFQDNMGIGIFFGEKRNINTEIKIGHYSNGNLFPDNPGVKIPLTFNLGYAF